MFNEVATSHDKDESPLKLVKSLVSLLCMKISKHLKIFGKVQGVYFRESMRQECMRIGVTGWVRNRNDGSVEALIQGEEILVNEIIQWSHQGPKMAKVEKVEVEEATNEPALSQFLRKESN